MPLSERVPDNVKASLPVLLAAPLPPSVCGTYCCFVILVHVYTTIRTVPLPGIRGCYMLACGPLLRATAGSQYANSMPASEKRFRRIVVIKYLAPSICGQSEVRYKASPWPLCFWLLSARCNTPNVAQRDVTHAFHA